MLLAKFYDKNNSLKGFNFYKDKAAFDSILDEYLDEVGPCVYLSLKDIITYETEEEFRKKFVAYILTEEEYLCIKRYFGSRDGFFPLASN